MKRSKIKFEDKKQEVEKKGIEQEMDAAEETKKEEIGEKTDVLAEEAEQEDELMEPKLPQNIIQIGEGVLEGKNIYIHQKVYEQIRKFAANKTENEQGGILAGRVINGMGKENTIIEGFIEAKYDAATPTTLTFTHETWDHFHSVMDRKYPDKKIVGWIHTHPNFGIFLSENDRFIQENFFNDTNQVAYVVDPIQKEEGFFFWVDKKLERCPGFYIFDKNGVKIRHPQSDEEEIKASEKDNAMKKSTPLVIALIVLLVLNLVMVINMSGLKKQIKNQELVMEFMILRDGIFEKPKDFSISKLADNIRADLESYAVMKQEMERQQQEMSSDQEPTDQQKNSGDVQEVEGGEQQKANNAASETEENTQQDNRNKSDTSK